jgi:hypothetical protein
MSTGGSQIDICGVALRARLAIADYWPTTVCPTFSRLLEGRECQHRAERVRGREHPVIHGRDITVALCPFMIRCPTTLLRITRQGS